MFSHSVDKQSMVSRKRGIMDGHHIFIATLGGVASALFRATSNQTEAYDVLATRSLFELFTYYTEPPLRSKQYADWVRYGYRLSLSDIHANRHYIVAHDARPQYRPTRSNALSPGFVLITPYSVQSGYAEYVVQPWSVPIRWCMAWT